MQERRKRRERKKHTYHQGLCSPLLFLTEPPSCRPRLRDPSPGSPGKFFPNESTPSKGGRTQTGEGEHPSFWDAQEGT